MSNLTVIQQKLLENLVDDSFDLFEIVSIVGSEMRGQGAAEQIASAKAVVRELLDDQLVNAWILPSIGAEEVPLPLERLADMFASDADWKLPIIEGARIRLFATPKGREAYVASGPPR